MALTIGLLGDVMLGRGVADMLRTTPPPELWSEELSALVGRECDLVIANLECCLSDGGRRTRLIRAKPFFFRGPPSATGALEAMNVRAVSCANNHALDYGAEALADTLTHLEAAGIAHAGAGPGMEAARGGAQVERLALVAVSDHPQEYAAGPQAWGIAWADLRRGVPEWLTGELERARAAGAFVVAFPHWGPNMAVRPARWQRERAADLVRAGAHLVAGHSAHLFHGVERLEPGLVLYDLGDALDDYAVDAHLRNDLGLLALWRPGSERREPELELLGLRGDYCHTRLARGADAEWIARRLEGACRELGTVVERTGEARFTVG